MAGDQASRLTLLPLQAERADPLVERRPLGVEQPRRRRDVPVGLVQRLPYPLALGGVAHFLQSRRGARGWTDLTSSGIASAVIRSPGVRIAIRSTTFLSSRMLPGQV